MKRFALSMTLGLSALVAAPTFAQPNAHEGIWMSDFDAAVEVAKKEGKNLFVDFTGSDWCGWCIKLDKEVFAHESWEQAATKDYVLVALDFPRGEEAKAKVPNPKRNAELQSTYSVSGFPTILMMTPDGDVFGRTGYQKGGPENYLEHMAALSKDGLAQLEAVRKIAGEYKAAEGDARMVVWERVAKMLEEKGAESAGSRHLVKIVEEGLTLDPKNEKGIYAKALGALMKAGKYKDEYYTKAKELDGKNTMGLLEKALLGRIQNVNSEETMESAVAEIEAFASLGKVVDKQAGLEVFAIGAYFAFQHKNDPELARTFAKHSAEYGGLEHPRFGDLLKDIMAADEEQPEEEEEVVEEVEEPVGGGL